MKDYMKRKISEKNHGYNSAYQWYFDMHGVPLNHAKKKERRAARHKMKQQLKLDCMDW